MKKLSLILLALLLCLSTACAQTLPAKDPAPVDTSEPSAAPTAEPTAEPTVEPTAEPTAEPIPEETMPLGAVSGTEYTNEYFGLKLTLPSTSWIFYNQEQLNALNGSTQAILEKADLDAFLEKAGSLIIASGSDLTTGNSCTLSMTPSAGVGALMTPALLKLSMENAVEPLRQSFVSMGYTVDSVQVETAQLMGKPFPVSIFPPPPTAAASLRLLLWYPEPIICCPSPWPPSEKIFPTAFWIWSHPWTDIYR